MKVEVCYADADGATRIELTIEAGAVVATAIDASSIVAVRSLDLAGLGLSVFGRRATLETVLEEGDRVELLRPLRVDPKEARRRRAARKQASSGS